MTYYVFFNKNSFIRVHKAWVAFAHHSKGYKVYRKETGIPNPWYVRQILKNGLLGKLKCIS